MPIDRIPAKTLAPVRPLPRISLALTWAGLVSIALLARASTTTPTPAPGRGLRFDETTFATGDLLFRRGRSLVSRAVLAADGSGEYSHVGLVSVVAGRAWVIHATPPEEPDDRGGVVVEPASVYLARERASAAALYRPLDRRAAVVAERVARGFARARLPFDAAFDLRTARELYCTELVWRAYRAAGVDLAPGAAARARYLLPSELSASPALQRILEIREEDER
jgi:hypothetical protein